MKLFYVKYLFMITKNRKYYCDVPDLVYLAGGPGMLTIECIHLNNLEKIR